MKKWFLLGIIICCFMSVEAYSRYLRKNESECPKNIVCQQNEILGDDGVCYPCDSDKIIEIQCTGWETVKKICPNRLLSLPALWSYLKCPQNLQEFEDHKGLCLTPCKEGFEGIEEFICKNKDTGESYHVHEGSVLRM